MPVARLLDGVEVVPLDDELGPQAGVLLKHTGGRDVIDAAVVLLACDGDAILTSDAPLAPATPTPRAATRATAVRGPAGGGNKQPARGGGL